MSGLVKPEGKVGAQHIILRILQNNVFYNKKTDAELGSFDFRGLFLGASQAASQPASQPARHRQQSSAYGKTLCPLWFKGDKIRDQRILSYPPPSSHLPLASTPPGSE